MKARAFRVGTCLALLLLILVISGGKAGAQSAIDEALFCSSGSTRPCPSVGICKDQVKACDNGKWSDECTGGTGPTKEICDNGLDDDCDGAADECVSFTEQIGFFLIAGGFVLLLFSLILSRIIK